jgi:serine/threonine protein kinase
LCIFPYLLLLLPLHQTPPPLQVRLLRRAADVAAGVSYLHSRNVCHGDLKCENVLLRSEPADPDGCMAKVADFGLSRALAYGQVRPVLNAAVVPRGSLCAKHVLLTSSVSV